MEIRRARRSDVPRLVRQYVGQSEPSRAFYRPFPFRPAVVGLILYGMVLSRWLGRGPLARWPGTALVLLVAEVPGEGLAGHTYYRVQRRHRGLCRAVVGVQVAVGFQGRGVGARLLEALDEEARRRRIRVLTATVHPDNEPSRRLFLRSGYTQGPYDPDAPRIDGRAPEVPFAKALVGPTPRSAPPPEER